MERFHLLPKQSHYRAPQNSEALNVGNGPLCNYAHAPGATEVILLRKETGPNAGVPIANEDN